MNLLYTYKCINYNIDKYYIKIGSKRNMNIIEVYNNITLEMLSY